MDSVTFHIVRRFELEGAVTAVCGPIAVTERTVLRIQQRIFEVEQRLDESDMSVFWRDGQYFRDEVTPERKRAALDVLRGDRDWLNANANVLPAEGSKDLGPEWRQITERFGRSFLDEFRAAQSSGQLLVCEDHLLRALGQREFGVGAAWLQPVLMQALEAGEMTREAYVQALVRMIDSRMGFISIGGPLLGQTVTGTQGHTLPPNFIKLASQLGGQKADLSSHLRAAFDAILVTWNDTRLSFTVRDAVVGTLLENLIRERPRDHVALIFGAFERFGRQVLNGHSLGNYLIDWLRGHFINLETLLAAPVTPKPKQPGGRRRRKNRAS